MTDGMADVLPPQDTQIQRGKDPEGFHIMELAASSKTEKKPKKSRKAAARDSSRRSGERTRARRKKGSKAAEVPEVGPPTVIIIRDEQCSDLARGEPSSPPEIKGSPKKLNLRSSAAAILKSAEGSVAKAINRRRGTFPAQAEKRERIIGRVCPQERRDSLSRDYSQQIKNIVTGRPIPLH